VEVEAGQAPDELNVRSAFLIHRSRHSTNVELHVGGRTDVLRRVDNGFRILDRTVMINASVLDAPNLALFV
jgi:hypothetical protein